MKRWRIERAGGPISGYLDSWLVMDPYGCGIPFPTFAQAIDYATTKADEYYAAQFRAAAAAAVEAVEAYTIGDKARLKRIADEALERWIQHQGGRP